MSEWDVLDAELEQWAAAHRVATLWWRDDDACTPSPGLTTLLRLSRSQAVPLGLAVIPATADPRLLDERAPESRLAVLQHGFAHINHARAEEKKAEFGASRPLSVMSDEIAEGAGRLRSLFGERFLRLFVPPWNRLGRKLVPVLPSLGFVGLSRFGPRPSALAAPGIKQVNTHVDLIDWIGGRGFKGTARVAEEIAAHLSARRRSEADPDEPTGILSHHLNHDEDCLQCLEALFRRTRGRENVRWMTPREALDT
jgi:hypothetical protein